MYREILTELSAIANDPFERLKAWKVETGKKIIGSTLADVPEELIHAAGFLPFTLLGTNQPVRRAASLLPDNCCSLDRSNLELALSLGEGLFDGYILPQADDTSQHLSDIWRRNVPGRYFESFLIPRQVNRPSAKAWLGDEIRRLKESLEDWTGATVEGNSIWRSIQIYNENRRMLREFYHMGRRCPGRITNRQLFEAIKSSMFSPREMHNEWLKKLFSELPPDQGASSKQGLPPVRLVLSGITWEPPEILSILDESGAIVVGDDLCVGTRSIEADVLPHEDPVQGLVERHFKKGPFSPIHDGGDRIFCHLVRLVKENRADGLLYLHIKFNDSQDYDLPDLKKGMQREKIPMLVLDIEYQTTHIAQTKTRIQAFLESLRMQAI